MRAPMIGGQGPAARAQRPAVFYRSCNFFLAPSEDMLTHFSALPV